MGTSKRSNLILSEIKMKLATLAKQALNYLASLKQPLPEESEIRWYQQNEKDYQALLTLNKQGLGATIEELTEVANPKKVRITKETSLNISFEVMENGKVIEKDFMDATIFWAYVSTEQLVYLGTKANIADVKKEFRNNSSYQSDQPFWYKMQKINCMKETLSWYLSNQLITEEQAEKLEDFIYCKEERITL